jgi:hypothetical protein
MASTMPVRITWNTVGVSHPRMGVNNPDEKSGVPETSLCQYGGTTPYATKKEPSYTQGLSDIFCSISSLVGLV